MIPSHAESVFFPLSCCFQFMDLIEACDKQPSMAELLNSFNEQSVSDYLVVYLRLVTSGYLQREDEFFQYFIEGGRTVREFCQQVSELTFHHLPAELSNERWSVFYLELLNAFGLEYLSSC